MSEKIFETNAQQIGSGLGPGIGKLVVPLWDTASNIYFDSFAARSNKGHEALGFAAMLFDSHEGLFDDATGLFDDAGSDEFILMQIDEVPTGLLQQRMKAGKRAVFIGSHTKLWRTEGDTLPIDVSGPGGYTAMTDALFPNLSTRWSMTQHGDWVISTNGREKPQIWKGAPATTFVDLGGLTGLFNTAQLVAKLGPHFLYINTDNDPREVRWSADGNPEALDPQVYVNAGRLLLNELASAAIAAVPLGRGLAVYSRSEMQMLNYIGSWGVIGASTTALVGVGAVGKFSIVPVGSQNYGMQKSGVFRTDGVNFQIVSDPAMGTWLERNINWDQGSKIAGRFNPGTKKITWSVLLVGSAENNRNIIYDTISGNFSFESVDFAFQVGTLPDTFLDPLVATFNGIISYADKGNSFNGDVVVRTLKTRPLDMGKRNKWKVLDQIQVEMKLNSGPGPMLMVGQHFEPELDLPPVWTGPFAVMPGPRTELKQFQARAEGVLLEFEFTSNGINDDWELNALKFFGRLEDGSSL